MEENIWIFAFNDGVVMQWRDRFIKMGRPCCHVHTAEDAPRFAYKSGNNQQAKAHIDCVKDFVASRLSDPITGSVQGSFHK